MKQIAVVDFGSQYTGLLVRFVERYAQVVLTDRLPVTDVSGIILAGSPRSARPETLGSFTVPVLGICYGLHILCVHFGGALSYGTTREYGAVQVNVAGSVLLDGMPNSTVWMSHGDTVTQAPSGFMVTARTTDGTIAAVEDTTRHIYAVQFHPEVEHTVHGRQVLDNFLRLCGVDTTHELACTKVDLSMLDGDTVICASSGGVDSWVTATLLRREIGDRLHEVFVNTGLLRATDEAPPTAVTVDARRQFISSLQGVMEPEQKRAIVGREFARVLEREALRVGASWLAQGTLRSDVIESGNGVTARIKSHHNVGGLPSDLELKVVEPLRGMFKDEVRVLGRSLGLPDSVVNRRPFPGPGLAIRIIGEVTEERLLVLRAADAVVAEETAQMSLWQAFAILLPVNTVGVAGDARTYGQVIALRAVTSQDAMTADWARLPYEVLARMSTRITNEVAGITRVVYDISSKPPATIEWE